MKYATIILSIFLLLPFVFAEESIKVYQVNTIINVEDLIVNTTGQPCYTCVCNFTLYNINNSFNKSYIMENKNNGFYNVSIGKLDRNQNNTYYPISIVCNDGTNYGTSSITGIKIVGDDMIYVALAIFMVCATFLFAYFAVALEPSDPIKIWMKWIFIFFSMVSLMGDMILGNIISNTNGYSSLTQFFEIMIWGVGAVILIAITFLILHLLFVNFYKLGKDNDDNEEFT